MFTTVWTSSVTSLWSNVISKGMLRTQWQRLLHHAASIQSIPTLNMHRMPLFWLFTKLFRWTFKLSTISVESKILYNVHNCEIMKKNPPRNFEETISKLQWIWLTSSYKHSFCDKQSTNLCTHFAICPSVHWTLQSYLHIWLNLLFTSIELNHCYFRIVIASRFRINTMTVDKMDSFICLTVAKHGTNDVYSIYSFFCLNNCSFIVAWYFCCCMPTKYF